MPRNGTGTFSLPAGNPVVAGTTILDTWANTTLPDIGTELTNSVPRDGQAPPTANLPMGGFRHTGAQDPSSAQDYATKNYIDTLTAQATITSLPALGSAGVTTLTYGNAVTLNGYHPSIVLAKSFVQAAMAANTTENTAFTVTVPAGSMGPNGYLKIRAAFNNVGATSTIAFRPKFGGTTLNSYSSSSPSTGLMIYFDIVIGNRGVANSQYAALNTTSAAITNTTAIDTAASTTFVITVQKTVGADVLNLEYYFAEIVPSA